MLNTKYQIFCTLIHPNTSFTVKREIKKLKLTLIDDVQTYRHIFLNY